MQLNLLNSVINLPPFIFFKGSYPPPNNDPRLNTVDYDIKHCLAHNSGNQYPPDNDLYMTCSKTKNSNGDITIDIL